MWCLFLFVVTRFRRFLAQEYCGDALYGLSLSICLCALLSTSSKSCETGGHNVTNRRYCAKIPLYKSNSGEGLEIYSIQRFPCICIGRIPFRAGRVKDKRILYERFYGWLDRLKSRDITQRTFRFAELSK